MQAPGVVKVIKQARKSRTIKRGAQAGGLVTLCILLSPILFFLMQDEKPAGASVVIPGLHPTLTDAYLSAADHVRTLQPQCQVPWWLLAGVGAIESTSLQGRNIDSNGNISEPVFGPPIRIGDTDQGHWDGQSDRDRAVGPMQFIPGTWRAYGVDSPRDSDSTADPQNVYDSTLSAANYLCALGRGASLLDEADQRRVLFGYNHSEVYVNDVMVRAHEFRVQGLTVPGAQIAIPQGSVQLTTVRGITVHAVLAPGLEALLAEAERDPAMAGLRLTGGGFRSAEDQIRLREAHCGPGHYNIYERPSGQCSPPTAKPGESMHEVGLAIDFNANGQLIRSRNSAAFLWLKANAPRYGLHNLPSEPWHWSINGG